MRTRIWLLLSVALNLALIGKLALAEYKKSHSEKKTALKKPFNPFDFYTKTNVVVRRLNFTWQEVESQDYATYIKNLRTIGCPETTIRDIIVADVDQLFAHRRTTETTSTNDFEWWRFDPDTNELHRIETKLVGLEEERRTLLTRLLGPDWDKPDEPLPADVRAGIHLTGALLGDLSAEKKQTVYAITERAKNEREQYLKSLPPYTAPNPAELGRLQQNMRDELSKVLSPEQLEEYLLRYSETAEQMRREFRGSEIEMTAEEFRTIFRVRDAMEQELALHAADANSPAGQKRRRELQQQLDDTMKQALGDRYLTLQLYSDPLFRETKSHVQQLGINASPELLFSLYEINQETEAERTRIRNDATLSPEDRIEALAAVQADQQKALQKLLGSDFDRWVEVQSKK